MRKKSIKNIVALSLTAAVACMATACGNSEAYSEAQNEFNAEVSRQAEEIEKESKKLQASIDEESSKMVESINKQTSAALSTESEPAELAADPAEPANNEEDQNKDEKDEAESAESEKVSAPHRSGDQEDGGVIAGVSDKNIDELNPSFFDAVPEDVTGNWRMAIIASDCDIRDYIYTYKNKYIKSSDEVHIIVNPLRGITTRINSIGSEYLSVAELSYVQGEEQSAKSLCGGDLQCEYVIYCDNGDIETY